MNINDIAEKAHNHAVKCGFYKDDAELEIISKIFEESEELMTSISDKRYCDMETFDQLHKDGNQQEHFLHNFSVNIKNSIGDEMADNVLTILAGALELGIDIEKHILYKQKYNGLREDHK